MTHHHQLAALLGVLALTLSALRDRLWADHPDRGDVPGWAKMMDYACHHPQSQQGCP